MLLPLVSHIYGIIDIMLGFIGDYPLRGRTTLYCTKYKGLFLCNGYNNIIFIAKYSLIYFSIFIQKKCKFIDLMKKMTMKLYKNEKMLHNWSWNALFNKYKNTSWEYLNANF